MSDKNKKETIYKLLVLGDTSVGKTCFLMRFTNNTFQDIYLTTIGMESSFKTIQLDNEKTVKVQIWDTAGQERFRSLCKNYYKSAHGIALLFDVTNKESFENVKIWVEQINKEAYGRISVILVGNKIDEVEKREVKKEDAENLANELGLSYFEASAKTGENVESCFVALVKKVVDNYSRGNSVGGTKLHNKSQQKKRCCS